MRYPNFSLERKLFQQGYQNIVGIDEVGRGALAGPIVAVAARISNFETRLPAGKAGISKLIQNSLRPCSGQAKFKIQNLRIRDSKLLSEKVREVMFEELSKMVIWSVGIVSHREIDKIGITRANFLIIKRALKKLNVKPDYLLLDKVNGFKHHLPFQTIIDGDRKVMSIAIASILAKVTRDRMMREYHLKYPDYHFDRHKGYGTKLHQRCLKKHGICRIHRVSYEPVSRLLSP